MARKALLIEVLIYVGWFLCGDLGFLFDRILKWKLKKMMCSTSVGRSGLLQVVAFHPLHKNLKVVTESIHQNLVNVSHEIMKKNTSFIKLPWQQRNVL